jgi:hypothetical protein
MKPRLQPDFTEFSRGFMEKADRGLQQFVLSPAACPAFFWRARFASFGPL